MANEAVFVTAYRNPVNMVVADGATIEKGTLLKQTDPNTAAASAAAADVFAGIAAAEKIASDGVTNLAVHTRGRFKVYLSGSCAVGDGLCTASTANYVRSIVGLGTGALSGSRILGRALETGATGETILIELMPTAVP